MPRVCPYPEPAAMSSSRAHWQWRRLASGFTLVELVVVMVVVGILVVVAIPRFSQLSGFKDAGYRDAIKSVLDYARKSAVARRRHTCVVIAADSSVTLTAELAIPENHAGSCPYAALNLPAGSNVLAPPANVVVTSPALPLTIRFDSQGRPVEGGGSVVAVTESSGGSTSSLTLADETGYVH